VSAYRVKFPTPQGTMSVGITSDKTAQDAIDEACFDAARIERNRIIALLRSDRVCEKLLHSGEPTQGRTFVAYVVMIIMENQE
jgi:hypothetical protein